MYGELFDSDDESRRVAYDDDGGEGVHFRIVRNLTQGQTVYLRASGLNDRAVSFVVSVSKPDTSDLTSGTLRVAGSTSIVEGQGLSALHTTVSDVYDNELTAGTDYELVYYRYDYDNDYVLLDAPPTANGEYYVAAKGIGAYRGETPKIYFTISPRNDLSYAEVELSLRHFSSMDMPDSLSSYVKVFAVGGEELTEGTHYTLRYAPYVDDYCDDEQATTTAPKEPGQYGVQAVAIKGGGYTGSTGWWIYDVWDAADIWASNGKDEDYMFGYTEEELENAL
jgi:hypothetical protein